jgi:hypothetical protein
LAEAGSRLANAAMPSTDIEVAAAQSKRANVPDLLFWLRAALFPNPYSQY